MHSGTRTLRPIVLLFLLAAPSSRARDNPFHNPSFAERFEDWYGPATSFADGAAEAEASALIVDFSPDGDHDVAWLDVWAGAGSLDGGSGYAYARQELRQKVRDIPSTALSLERALGVGAGFGGRVLLSYRASVVVRALDANGVPGSGPEFVHVIAELAHFSMDLECGVGVALDDGRPYERITFDLGRSGFAAGDDVEVTVAIEVGALAGAGCDHGGVGAVLVVDRFRFSSPEPHPAQPPEALRVFAVPADADG